MLNEKKIKWKSNWFNDTRMDAVHWFNERFILSFSFISIDPFVVGIVKNERIFFFFSFPLNSRKSEKKMSDSVAWQMYSNWQRDKIRDCVEIRRNTFGCCCLCSLFFVNFIQFTLILASMQNSFLFYFFPFLFVHSETLNTDERRTMPEVH